MLTPTRNRRCQDEFVSSVSVSLSLKSECSDPAELSRLGLFVLSGLGSRHGAGVECLVGTGEGLGEGEGDGGLNGGLFLPRFLLFLVLVVVVVVIVAILSLAISVLM